MILGTIYMTNGITNAALTNEPFFQEVLAALDRYRCKDWGDLCEEDKQANEYALKHDERILAKYETSKGPIYIITEWDRKTTTVLFTDEY
jgi:hypothetical protein